MDGDVTYEVVRNEVHEAIWRLRGADQTRILIEVERLRQLADQIRDPAERDDALFQVLGLRTRTAPPVRLKPPPEGGSCLVPAPPQTP